MLPADTFINFPADIRSAQEKAAFAMCKSHPILDAEMKGWMYKNYSARLTVTPDQRMDLSYGIEWAKFRRIDIDIDHYQMDETSNEFLESPVPQEWPGMVQAVASLN